MRVCTVLMALWFLGACSLIPIRQSDEALRASAEAQAFAQIERHIKAQNFEGVLASANQFQEKYPYSLQSQKARFLKGTALEELGRWSEAEGTYKAISVISEKTQPQISSLALYRLSFVYEALGDEQRVIASLFEAAKFASHLPPEVIHAEIPSRLARVYAKENNAKEAKKWLAEADAGLKKTLDLREEPLTSEWLAQIYYNMGSISTDQLSNDNIITLIQGQQAVQKYLIRSLQYADPVWSVKALAKLKTTYLTLWKTIESFPEPSGYEALVAQKMKNEEQLRLSGPFSELLSEAELYRPGVEQQSNQYQSEFFSFIEELQTRVRSVLESALYTPLMPKRDKPPQRSQTPVKTVPSEDPNL